MNQIVTTNEQPLVQMQQPMIQLPSDPMQLMALAKDLANARLIPTHFQKSPADCWLVMAFCRNRGLDFFMVAPECNVVKGRLFFSGKLTQALLNTSGYLAERIDFEYEGTGDDLAVIVSGRLTSEPTPRTVRVELKKVRTENEMWRKQPEQQLAYSGARIWGRRHLPEVLMGLMFEGDVIDVTPTEIRTHPAMSQDQRSTAIEQRDTNDVRHVPKVEQDAVPSMDMPSPAESENTIPHALALITGAGEAESWSAWAVRLMAYIRYAPSIDAINEWTTVNAGSLAKLKEYDGTKHQRLIEMIQHQIALRNENGS